MQENIELSASERADAGKKCTWVGFCVNALLSVLKIMAGVFGHSGAMIADGIHSASDFVTDIIVIAFLGVTARKPDRRHSYGHGKFETFATFLISVALFAIALFLFKEATEKIVAALNGTVLMRPTYLALSMAAVSVVAKEILFRYTRNVGVKINSATVIANAWHHRSDSFSSIAAFAGIAGAMFLGEDWRILDPIVALLVSIFIVVVAVKLSVPAISELLESSLPEEINEMVGKTISETPGVKSFHRFRSRKNGIHSVFDFHIQVNPDISVTEAHDISSDVEARIGKIIPHSITNVHIEPYHPGQTVK